MNRSCSPLVDVAIGDIALRGGVVGIANDVLLSTQFSVLPNTFVIVVDVGPLDVNVAVVVVALIDAELGSVIVP